MSAADPDGLQANQGFNVTVGQSGIKQATVAIFGLRDVEDRSKSINPTSVSGNISVILDVQPNDETVTAIALTLGDETIQCRGTSADASSPVAGLAESGGQIEVDCFLDTDAVNGACMGMQLDPTYANGDYALGAFVTTDEGNTRSVVATQPITLKNSGFVIISHEAGANSVVSSTTQGLTFYGGPADEGNVNSFHACPVSYTGTVVAELALGSIHTNTDRPPVATDPQPARSEGMLSLRRAQSGRYGADAPADNEAPFTWPIGTASWTGNRAVENMPGETEYWIENRGLIKNADGLDVTGEFRGDETAKAGPFHFDFSAPRLSVGGTSAIIARRGGARASITDGIYLSNGDRRTQYLTVSNVEESGVGGVNEVIAVGDCSITANNDNKTSTAFVAAYDDVRNISELPEDDPLWGADDLSDDGGLQCYIAELQALEDAIGNSTWLGNTRVQSGDFGVDRGAPELRRLRPDETLVLGTDMLTFEANDPDLETGEDGSGLPDMIGTGANAIVGGVLGQRYSSSDADYVTNSDVAATRPNLDEDVSVDISGLAEGSHDLRILVGDDATPTNWNAAFFEFVRDTEDPTFTVGSGPGAVSAGSSDRVTVTISGSIRDANVIDKAELSVWANGGSSAICGPDDSGDSELPRSRVGVKDVENDTKRIDFEESFTIRKAAGGSEPLCFRLHVVDVAVDASGDDDGANEAFYTAGFFTINWGLGMTLDGTDLVDGALEIAEGSSATYDIVLDAEPSDDVTVTVSGVTGSNVTLSGGTAAANGDDQEFTFTAGAGGNWATAQTLTVTAAEDARDATDPEDAANDMVTLTHTAEGGGYDGVSGADVEVTVTDDDVKLTVSDHSITAGGEAASVTITASVLTAPSGSDRTVSVTLSLTDSGGATVNQGTSTGITTVAITISDGSMSGSETVSVVPGNTAGTITVGAQTDDQATATITISAGSG